MAGPAASATDSPLLRGLFGVFQTSSAARADTSTIWSDLRTAAGSWQFSAQGVAQPYDPAAVQEAGRAILSAQGIDAGAVSTFRGLAGQWRNAAERLQALEPGQQITGNEIFVPPWAATASSNVPSRYRIRSQWQFEAANGVTFNQWRADELTGPLTTTVDAVTQVPPPTNTYPPQDILSDAGPPTLLGYQVEQI